MKPSLPKEGESLLEPSFATAIAAVESSTDLPAYKRSHWSCSLRQIAKAFDAPAELIAARWSAIKHRVKQLHHARIGMERKTLANHISNVKAALRWYGKEEELPQHGAPLRPEWQALRGQIPELFMKSKLSGLIRYAAMKEILPEQVDDTVLAQYMRYRADTTALATDIQAERAIARAWNGCAERIQGWPRQCLTEPPVKTGERPHWSDFPQGLRDDLGRYIVYLSGYRRAKDNKRLKPCGAVTLRTKAGDLKAFAKMAVRVGKPIKELVSFTVLLHPDVVRPTLDAYWKRDGEQPSTFTIDLPKKLVLAARGLKCLDDKLLAELEEIRANLEQYRRVGLTPKNRALVRQVLTGGIWPEVVNTPWTLMAKARSLKDHASRKAAIMAQIAVAIVLLTVAPVRIANLAATRLGENLIKPGGPNTPYWFVFPDYDVKNEIDLNFTVSEDRTELIEEYIHEFRPRLISGQDEGWLFPSPQGGHKTEHLLSLQIKDRVKKATGLVISAHQFRHAGAAIYLQHHPGDYETRRRILGHKNIRTTIRHYAGLESLQATRTFGKIIDRYLDISDQEDGEDD